MMRKLPLRLAVLILLLSIGSCGLEQPQTVLKLAHTLDQQHSVHRAMEFMDERLQMLSGGSMRIDIYPGGQLGSERELIELLQIGSLAMTKVSASPMEGFVPELKIFNLPYVFRDADHFWAVLQSDIGRKLLLAGERARLRGLGYFDAGSRSFYVNDKPIYTPEDLKGLKIRVQNSQTAIKMVNTLGGAATPVSWGELYTALQQGVVQGAENNPPSFYLSKHYEVSRYYTLDEHTYVPDMLLISTEVWKKLNARQRAWLQQAVDEAVDYQRTLWQESTRESLAAVEAAGVKVIYPDKQPFIDAVKPLHASFAGTEVGDLLAQIARL
ncbi:TRAP transporter substrate-binding protein [Microbulbifer thermotolerans]|uniref:TRAP transporter substrate-binding protein n=2 Tax=Microbulbifer thermotolerans TaxID=252514 RepID=A0AB35HSU2_MICTH|nr:TRAP transporter substrate-binding protein [Microbulbifer thermotolerans]MCX2783300.1 TRAP transporter substrate-binding protein [Microbulbifer thermotolerans]MCX2796103.1 TRAP transporter substrate-binding protein [Microbulbifer thermotolerans]MCX2800382.1 TRAP transporter substrate-binding protein [Microbulbifer thermotolerans]MCX2832179.1 TRAP transporter substrate-binding protein [Microbulbifer thermotolerans]MCX2834067.1 TRAP transporter substrate-binding protein [Microbulbifer thermot